MLKMRKGLVHLLLIKTGHGWLPPFTPVFNTASNFDWTSIDPSSELIWYQCYHHIRLSEKTSFTPEAEDDSNTFQCARLSVSLDWHDDSNLNNSVAIAVIKLPAQNRQQRKYSSETFQTPLGSSHHAETIVYNPGGPGGSGVASILQAGYNFQELVAGDSQFDILSFDPRGVGFSENVHCFDDTFSEDLWTLREADAGELGMNDDVLATRLAYARGRADLCATRHYNNSHDNLRAYMSTAFVARDMLEIVRKESLNKLNKRLRQHSVTTSSFSSTNDGATRLNFIGQSYGTFLGATFASMYPQHVGKMLLDGNIDAEDQVSKWPIKSVVDFEELLSFFLSKCFAAKQKCRLWRPFDIGPADIKARVEEALQKVRRQPVPVDADGVVDLITYTEVKLAMFSGAYISQALPFLAAFLDSIYEDKVSNHLPWLVSRLSCADRNSSALLRSSSYDAKMALLCSDAEFLANATAAEFKQYLTEVSKQSPNAGPILASTRLPCMVWPKLLQTKWRFDGPFGSTNFSPANPSILFLNNRLDPVTPIRNARKMANLFPGSAVLEQDAVGHCAIGPVLGRCTAESIRSFFNQGKLPKSGTICPGLCQPFDDACGVSNIRAFGHLWDAWM